MKKLIILFFLFTSSLYAQTKLKMESVQIGGYVGGRIEDCIRTRVQLQDVDHLTAPFRTKNDTASWQTEFWGKWVQGAIASYRYNHSVALYAKIKKSVDDIISTQQPDGYIGNYRLDAQLKSWDIWGRKYTTLGLLSWYEISGEKQALNAACRVIDHLMTQVGEGGTNIVTTGNYYGMASSSILEPVMYLYKYTGDYKYLQFAKYIVAQWETPEGPQLITKAINEVPVAARFPHPFDWFSPENGQKAYEMMSCYIGLLELYKVTHNAAYLDAVQKTVNDIANTEINVAGSGSAFESWYSGRKYQTSPTYHTMETCVTFTWMQLCDKLLALTGNPFYADQIEKSLYNALMAALKDDASQIAKYSPMEGHRCEGEEQCGMHINCCNANGPRAFALIPDFAVKKMGNEVYVNYYGDMSASLENGHNKVLVKQHTTYPVSNVIDITIDVTKENVFGLHLRVPVWSAQTVITLNGEELKDICPGTYHAITRKWKKGDHIQIILDMPARLLEQNQMQAIVRGPIVLARDSRFNDGFVDETLVVDSEDGIVKAEVDSVPGFAWMRLKVPVTVGTDLEGVGMYRNISFCDFASAGNTWDKQVRYRVWIPRTLDVKKGHLK